MSSLAKTDPIDARLQAEGIDLDSHAAIAIREAVRGGDSIEDAIEAFAPTPSALATQAQSVSPVVKGKGGKKPVNIQATPVIPVANSQYATDGEIAQVQEVAFEAGVNLASSLGNANRAGFASGFVAQASAEAEGTSNFREGLVAGFVASI
jgi:hypothetical protein